ncbi:MAG: peptidoglycan DD-metalloendopeptidase family protein [Patescibacteria group bacterium]
MKQYPVYKKRFSSIFLGVLLMGVLVLPSFFTYAETAQELQNKINQKDSDIARLEKEIASYQVELNNLEKQKDTLSGAIKELDLTKKKLNTDITITQTKIDRTNLKIQSLNDDIGNKEDSISNNKNSISLGIKQTNEFEQDIIIETILSENAFTVIWNDIDNMITVREKIREKIVELQQVKGELEDTRKETINAKNELTALKSKLSDQQKIVIQNTNEKNKLLKQTRNNEANYQKLLKDRIAQRDAFEKELRDYEAQLQYILDPSKLPNAGVLSWPLEQIYVTQLFGKTVDAKRLYASGTHNGVDFRASVGTPVMAMSDGGVLGIGDTDLTCAGASFGKYVFIEYNNGLSSTFGHLSLIRVREGENVKRGQVVAYSGATGHVTGPHLHVSLYASEAVKMASKPSSACDGRIYRLPIAPINAYLDAMYYLPPYRQ